MTVFELLIFVSLGLAVAARKRHAISLCFCALGYAIAAVTIFAGEFRWPIAFAYLALFMISWLEVSDFRKRSAPKDDRDGSETSDKAEVVRRNFLRVGGLLAAISLFLVWACPNVSLPAPRGPYKVGTCTITMVDNSRPGLLPDEHSRELPVQVWYPVKENRMKLAPFMQPSNVVTPFFEAPLFAIVASHLHLIRTHSSINDDPVTAPNGVKFPLLIFSHGLFGGRIQNIVQIEDLVSNGYVVAALDHTHDAAFAIFPEKTVTSDLVRAKIQSVALTDEHALDVRRDDVCFVADKLSMYLPKAIGSIVDFSKIGVFGHSLGGQTAMLSCAKDSKISAGLALDGFSTRAVQSGIPQPFIYMQADRPSLPPDIDAFCKPKTGGPHLFLKLLGAQHANFTDLPFLTPMHWILGISGPIEPKLAMQLIEEYSLTFFDQYLKHKDSHLLDGTSNAHPEMEFENISDSNK